MNDFWPTQACHAEQSEESVFQRRVFTIIKSIKGIWMPAVIKASPQQALADIKGSLL